MKLTENTAFKDRTLNVRPDTLDFRDLMYVSSLFEVPTEIKLEEYKEMNVPILDQGKEGACTGFGLATVVNYLLKKRKVIPDHQPVSPWMFYEMAKRYDEWPGENYSGSSARGAMKGWHKHGVCNEEKWPYAENREYQRLNDERTSDALKRPLGAYYRVNHLDLVAIHSAIAEVGILYATCMVHEGWDQVDPTTGKIPLTNKKLGGHAFAIVGYTEQGFWIQNSWGKKWGFEGFGLISYDDWLMNATDVWVARLGAPVILNKVTSTAIANIATSGKSVAYSYADLRPHIISIGNDGKLRAGGDYGTTADEVKAIFNDDFPRVTGGWTKKRLLLYAHGGLVSENAAVQRLAEYRTSLLKAEIYPISFIWKSDAWTTITNILQDAFKRRRPEGFLDASKDFMLDRFDDALEPIARALSGKLQWDEMKENALLATKSKSGGVRFALDLIAELASQYSNFEIHVVGHSAGGILHAPLVQYVTSNGKISSGPLKGEIGLNLKIKSCTLWAPACTINLFKETYLPAINSKAIERFALFTLTDRAEQDDHCAHIYNKSLLYLVSNSFEEKARIPLFRDGEPILGMQKFIDKDNVLLKLFKTASADWILSPNSSPPNSTDCSTATSHGSFDDDEAAVRATFSRILNTKMVGTPIAFKSSPSKSKDRREALKERI